MDKTLIDNLIVRFSDLGLKLLGALAVWIIGRWLIHFGLNLLVARLEARKVDHTVVGYAKNTASVALNIALVVVLMGVLGIETTSFAAFIAGAGLAIGAAWSGLLSNFAAGAFVVILRPFKAGDQILAGGVRGTVVEVGLFVTTINTEDNVRTYLGNSKILSDTLRNFSANASRRIDLTGTIKRSDDVEQMIEDVRKRLLQIPNVLATPSPEIKILSFNTHGCTLAIRPYTHNSNYWQVYFDATRSMKDLLGAMGLQAASHSGEEGETLAGEGAEGSEHEEEAE